MRIQYKSKYFLTLLLIIGAFLICQISSAQTQVMKGKVYAFKYMPLNNIQIESKKTGNVYYSDINGEFTIPYIQNDKIILKGHGFERVTYKIADSKSISIKMIFKTSTVNKKKVLANKHLNYEQLDYALQFTSEYNSPAYLNQIQKPFNRNISSIREQQYRNYSKLQTSRYNDEIFTIENIDYLK